MKVFGVFVVLLIFVLVIVFFQVFYIVWEDQQVIIMQFGKFVGQLVVELGFKFKLFFVQKVQIFDKCFFEWQGDVDELLMCDKVLIFVDVYVCWCIFDVLFFY